MDIEIINRNIEDMLVNRGDDVSSFRIVQEYHPHCIRIQYFQSAI